MTYGVPGWTDDRTAQLKALVDRGLTAREIGIEMGVTRSAVIGKISRLGLRLFRIQSKKSGTSRVKRITPVHRNGVAVIAGTRAAGKREASRAKALSKLPATDPVKLPFDNVRHVPVALLDLRDEHCRWPISDDADSTIGYCGAPRRDEKVPYCAGHCRMAYRPLRNITEHERERRSIFGKMQVASGAWSWWVLTRGEV